MPPGKKRATAPNRAPTLTSRRVAAPPPLSSSTSRNAAPATRLGAKSYTAAAPQTTTAATSTTAGGKRGAKRMRTEENNDEEETDGNDGDEDVTLEQLGRQLLKGSGGAGGIIMNSPLTSSPPSAAVMTARPSALFSSSSKTSALDAVTTNTNTNAAAVVLTGGGEGEKRGESWGSFSISGTSASSLALTPGRAGTTSPERLTSRNSNTAPLLSTPAIDGTTTNNNNNANMGGDASCTPPRSGVISYMSDDDKNNNICSERASIALSPAERPSTTLIRKAAATRPAASPATLWICIDDDDDDDTNNNNNNKEEEEEMKDASCVRSPAAHSAHPGIKTLPPMYARDNATHSMNAAAQQQQQQQQPTPSPPPLSSPRREPIAEVLPPTFRSRKGPLQAHKPPPRTLSPLPNGWFIYDDDVTEDEDEEEDNKNSNSNDNYKKNKDAERDAMLQQRQYSSNAVGRLLDVSATTQTSCMTLPYNTSMLYIIDDDFSDSSSSSQNNEKKKRRKEEDEEGQHNNDNSYNVTCSSDLNDFKRDLNSTLNVPQKRIERGVAGTGTQKSLRLPLTLPTDESALSMSFNSDVGSPTRSVRDFLFSSRRQNSFDWDNSSFSSLTTGTIGTVKGTTPATIKGLGGDEFGAVESKRAVERLRPLFEKRFTRKSFLDTVENVVSKLHCLNPGEFWPAFVKAEYVGEGSFGIVWRCQTIDGDLVAVKSCPISFHSRGSIDDAFSVLREIAIMRFLNEHEVPYILPLHSAFFVQAREALPPDVVAAVEWKVRLEKEKAEEERRRKRREQQQLRKKGGRGRGRRELLYMQPEEEEEEEGETEEKIKERMQHEKVRLPRFLSISVEDATECDATVFLVTELCDGDLESIERHDSITKGVAFSVSSALHAMHQLGLVHLDLKPSNILFAYENSPSQLQYHSHRQQQQQLQQHQTEEVTSSGNAVSVPSSLTQTPPSTTTTGVMRVTNTPTAGSVKFYLSDFGNCRIVGPDISDEVTGVFGTLEYMDSRALQDKTCSRATDCFSLGATLYELIYSRRLYPPCRNPKCVSEEDHTRHCYIDAARQPVVVASPAVTMSPSTSILQKVMAGLLALDQKERWTAERCRSFFLINGVTNTMSTAPTA